MKFCKMLHILWKDGRNVHLSVGSDVVLGRSPETGITSLKCSRNQVRLSYNEHSSVVNIMNIGKREVTVNKKTVLKTGEKATLEFGDTFELPPGDYGYKFEKDEKTPVDSSSEHLVDFSGKTPATNCWKKRGTLLIYNSPGLENRSKIASFDLDGTLICTQSGYRFPKDDSDWRILYPQVPGILKRHYADGYKIVVFTNQKGLTVGRQSEEGFTAKVDRIRKTLGVPLQCFVSSGDGHHRKPLTGMWDEMERAENGVSTPVDRTESFYVGDAAGREENKTLKRSKDHSSADRLFALNLNLKFYTPEEFFLGKSSEPYSMPDFDPTSLFRQPPKPLLEPATAKLYSDSKEIIVLVGYPASGKSCFVEQHLAPLKYVSVNRDTLKSWQKCVAKTEQCLKLGQSVVVDNTNPNIESRSRYTRLAKQRNVKCRCFVMNVTLDQARHNNKFRELSGLADKDHKNVTDIILYGYRKDFQAPQLSEGFDEIVHVNFIPKFDDQDLKRLYSMYLLEK